MDTRAHAQSEWEALDLAAAWRRWRSRFAEQTRSLTEALIEHAQVGPGMRVLDLASGAGEPALALARAVGPRGHVIATDVSEAMLAIIADVARAEGITNLTCRRADASALPFPDASFDVVTSRLGIMHVHDAAEALREARRVLKPGGRVAFLVWGVSPDEDAFFSHHRIVARHIEMPPRWANEPGLLRFARPGHSSVALREADFRDVAEMTRRCLLPFSGTPAELWQAIGETLPPLGRVLGGLSAELRSRINEDAETALQVHRHGSRIDLPATVHIVTGIR